MKEGWELKELEKLFDVKSSKRVHKADWKKNGVPFYRAREVVKLAQNGKVDNDLFISEELFEEFTKGSGAPKKGDIIISAVGTLGQCYLVKVEDRFYFKDASVLWFEKISDVNTKYIEYAFKSDLLMKQVMHKAMGATVGTLTIGRARKIKIPVPPLNEQKQIVAILDKAFVAIDQAIANVEKNIENAQELFQSKLNDIFSQRGEGWEENKFEDVSTRIGDGLHGTPNYDENGEYFFINGSNLDDGKIIIQEKTKKVNKNEFEKHKRELTNNTVLISINGTLGKVAFYNQEPVILGKSACYINFTEKVNKHYIKYLVNSPLFFENMTNSSTGATIKNFSLKSMRNYTLFLPTIHEQETIVTKLIQFQNEIIDIEKRYNTKLNSLEELKKSILQKAFAGELVE